MPSSTLSTYKSMLFCFSPETISLSLPVKKSNIKFIFVEIILLDFRNIDDDVSLIVLSSTTRNEFNYSVIWSSFVDVCLLSDDGDIKKNIHVFLCLFPNFTVLHLNSPLNLQLMMLWCSKTQNKKGIVFMAVFHCKSSSVQTILFL